MIVFEDVSFHYEDGSGVADLNIHIGKGECVVLTGASGCGKTTVTRLINALVPNFYPGTFSGRIKIRGKREDEMRPEQLAGMVGSVFQNPRSQFFNLDTSSEVAFTAENLAMPPSEIRRSMENVVQILDIERLMERNILTLSSGEKQLIAMASVMTSKTEIYVLDEPSANLDAFSVCELTKVLNHLKQMGKTIVVAEHRLYYLRGIADRFIHMEKGHITNEWSAEEFSNLSDTQRQKLCLRTLFPEQLLPIHSEQTRKVGYGLKIEKILFHYNKGNPIVKDLSCEISPGEVIGFVGKNGQGKTTLSKILCGFEREKSGSLLWKSKSFKAKKRHLTSYLVMQEPSYQLFTESVEQEMRMTDSLPTDNQIKEMLVFLGLSQCTKKHPFSLSAGEKQRLSIGVAMMQKSEILIMDEPTSGLDFENMLRISQLVKRLREQGKIVIIISHDYEFILQTCTRILHMESGSIHLDYMLNNINHYLLRDFFVSRTEKI